MESKWRLLAKCYTLFSEKDLSNLSNVNTVNVLTRESLLSNQVKYKHIEWKWWEMKQGFMKTKSSEM